MCSLSESSRLADARSNSSSETTNESGDQSSSSADQRRTASIPPSSMSRSIELTRSRSSSVASSEGSLGGLRNRVIDALPSSLVASPAQLDREGVAHRPHPADGRARGSARGSAVRPPRRSLPAARAASRTSRTGSSASCVRQSQNGACSGVCTMSPLRIPERAARAQLDPDVPGRVAGRGADRDRLRQLGHAVHRGDQSGLDDRQHAVLVDVAQQAGLRAERKSSSAEETR